MEPLEKKKELVFHGFAFIMDVCTVDGDLVITAEEKETGDRWKGQFSSRYIEEITRKTGNYKKFTVFVQMLMQSLDGQSDSVFIDLLTYSDLELLKSRKTGKSESTSAASKANNKRYLIMTYAVEYDRVHYPLPLNFEEAPDPANLKITISRLRQELADLKSSVGYGDVSADVSLSAIRSQLQQERRAREQAEASLAASRRAHSRAIGEIEKAHDNTRRELENAQRLLHERGVRESREDEQEVRELRERLDEKEEELAVRQAEHKRAVAKFRKENSALQLEFDKARNAAKQSRAKLAQVENELAICRKRLQLAKTRPGTPLDDSSNRSSRRPASGQRSRRESGGGTVRSRSPGQNRSASGGGRSNSNRKTRPQSAPIRGGSSGSESERPRRYGRSPSPAQKRRGASPSLTRPTSADRRRREEVARRERERERELEKRNRFAGGSNGRSQRATSAERRRAYSESLRERQGFSPAGSARSRRRGGGAESGSEAEQSDRSVGSRGSRGRRVGSQRKPPAKKKPAARAKHDDGASMYSEDSIGDSGGKYDTGAEIADIDSRLNALQSFLRQAKESSGGR